MPSYCKISLFVAFAVAFSGHAQVIELHFERIGRNRNLSQSTVYDLAMDGYGFLWIGTYDGLNRFDGQSMRTYKTSNSSLPDNHITALCVDRHDNLWIGTSSSGFAVLDIDRDEFLVSVTDLTEKLASSRPVDISAFTMVSDRIFALTNVGVVEMGVEGGIIRLEDFHLNDVSCFDGNEGSLWFGTLGGFVHHHRVTPGAQKMECSMVDIGSPVTALTVWDEQHAVAAVKGGIKKVRRDGFVVEDLSSLIPVFLSNSALTPLERDAKGRLWMGSKHEGGARIDVENMAAVAIRSGEMEYSYPENSVSNILADGTGMVYLGSFGYGVQKYDSNTEWIKHYRKFGRNFDMDYVSSILVDSKRRLWFGSQNQGLFVYDESITELVAEYHDPLESITVIRECSDGSFLIGTAGAGVFQIANDSTVRSFEHNQQANENGSMSVTAIQEIENQIWVSTNGAGVFVYDKGRLVRRLNHASEPAILDDKVWECTVDSQGRVWLGTFRGLSVLTEADQSNVVNFRTQGNSRGLLHNTVDVVYEDSKGNIWLGTPAGLSLLLADAIQAALNAPDVVEFRHYTSADGLPNDVIYATVEDDQGWMWISTNRGLAHLDPVQGKVETFGVVEGGQGDEYNSGAVAKIGDGRVLFGGVSGLNVIEPHSRGSAHTGSEVIVTSFAFDLGRKFISLENLKLPPVELKYQDAVGMLIDFALPYQRAEQFEFLWKLEGLHDDWISLGSNTEIEITALNPGKYTLEVEAVENGWSSPQKLLSVPIRIVPPYWQSWWFRTLMLIAAAVLLNFSYFGLKRLILAFIFWRKTVFIGPYRVLNEIGKGGMGTVFRASDVTTKEIVALKVLDQFIPDDTRRRRFLQESLICETLKHPNIIKIFNKGEHGGRIYYAMECVNGATLRQIMDSVTFGPATTLMFAAVLCDILGHIHENGVVHRDFKPENIMLKGTFKVDQLPADREGLRQIGHNIRLLDFGLAKVVGYDTITRSGVLAGTICYLPPEYISGKGQVGPHLDFYALGIILYEMLAGVSPFPGTDYLTLVYSIMKRDPRPLREIEPDVPADVSDFVLGLIDKDPHFRFKDVETIEEKIEDLLNKYVPLNYGKRCG